jgi:hypothetical protein
VVKAHFISRIDLTSVAVLALEQALDCCFGFLRNFHCFDIFIILMQCSLQSKQLLVL